MTFWWKFATLSAFLAAYGAAVWHVHGWYDSSKEVRAVGREEAAAREEMRKSSVIDTGFDEAISKLHQLELSANQRIEAAHETPATAPCGLDPVRLSVLRSAIAAGQPAR